MISLIISSTSLGLLLSDKLKKKVTVCSQLSVMCDMLCLDLGFTVTPVTQLINRILLDERLDSLNFISAENVKSNRPVKSCLSNSENIELSKFLYSLGKSDVKSQIKLINGFKEYIKERESEYNFQLKKNSKLYISFGFFGGLVISLVLI